VQIDPKARRWCGKPSNSTEPVNTLWNGSKARWLTSDSPRGPSAPRSRWRIMLFAHVRLPWTSMRRQRGGRPR
jgi:hypothetical protein